MPKGIPARPINEEESLLIVKMYREGVTFSEMSRILSRPRTAINRHIELIRYKYNLAYRYGAYEVKKPKKIKLPKPHWALIIPWTKPNSSRYYFPK